MVISGLYSPHQINIAKAVEVFEKGTGAAALDVGMLVLVKSVLPGFVVEPIVKNQLLIMGSLRCGLVITLYIRDFGQLLVVLTFPL